MKSTNTKAEGGIKYPLTPMAKSPDLAAAQLPDVPASVLPTYP